MYTLVYHSCYDSHRVYSADDPYLRDYPSMYSEIASGTYEEMISLMDQLDS